MFIDEGVSLVFIITPMFNVLRLTVVFTSWCVHVRNFSLYLGYVNKIVNNFIITKYVKISNKLTN